MNVFKNQALKDFEVAQRALNDADACLVGLSDRTSDIEKSISENERQRNQHADKLKEISLEKISFSEVEIKSKQVLVNKQRDDEWHTHLLDIRESAARDLAAAKLVVIAAEENLLLAQKAMHEAIFRKQFDAFVAACRKPLIELLNAAYRAHLFEAARSKSTHVARAEAMLVAKGLWAIDLESAVADMIEKDSEFLDANVLDGVDALSSITRSSLVSNDERSAIKGIPETQWQDALLRVRALKILEQETPVDTVSRAALDRSIYMSNSLQKRSRELQERVNTLERSLSEHEHEPAPSAVLFNSDGSIKKVEIQRELAKTKKLITETGEQLEIHKDIIARFRSEKAA